MIRNLHERVIAAPVDEVGALIDSLGSKGDRLWPLNDWPAMRLDSPLGVGVAGGHGPVRYCVTAYEPGRRVQFKFTRPTGFHGHHTFMALGRAENTALMRHELVITLGGTAVITWPLFFRPLHDALIEDCLDRAERECGASISHHPARSLWTRVLRASFSAQLARRRARQGLSSNNKSR
jgi:hypothetical protein